MNKPKFELLFFSRLINLINTIMSCNTHIIRSNFKKNFYDKKHKLKPNHGSVTATSIPNKK